MYQVNTPPAAGGSRPRARPSAAAKRRSHLTIRILQVQLLAGSVVWVNRHPPLLLLSSIRHYSNRSSCSSFPQIWPKQFRKWCNDVRTPGTGDPAEREAPFWVRETSHYYFVSLSTCIITI